MSTATEVNPTLRAARAYNARGLKVFPLNGKIPATTNGCDDATDDVAQVEAWFPRVRNIAILTPPRVVIVDVDPRNGGDRTLSEWCAEHGVEWLADVPRVRTGGGGMHYWFRYSGEPLKKSIEGVDFQRGNKYVVAPPSTTDKPYRWEVILPDDLSDLPELPEWLLELARPPKPLEPTGDVRHYDDGADPLDTAVRRMTSLSALLRRHGWTLVKGDGDGDGSHWRHPTSDNPFSASVKYGCLFVYSPTPGLPVTEDSAPHGITLFNLVQKLDFNDDKHALVQALRNAGYLESLERTEVSEVPIAQVSELDAEAELALSGYLDWPEAFSAEDDIEQRWLVEPILAIGRSHALYAPAKVGKSLLLLGLAAALASGREFLDMPAHDPVPVLYLDYEMTRDDVVERLETYNYAPPNLKFLHYALLSSGNGLDTPAGAADVVHDAEALGVGLVIVDTLSRAITGAENDADTMRAFYRCTGAPLKRRGISVIRLDHAGKDALKGQRGTSAKNDDVDIVWRLTGGQGGAYDLESTYTRMGWVERKVALTLTEDEDTGVSSWTRRGGRSYPERTSETAALLKDLGAPVTISKKAAATLLRKNGWKGRNDVVLAALRFRNELHKNDLPPVGTGR